MDVRHAITIEILTRLLNTLPRLCSLGMEAILFKAAFSVAFFGAFKVSELMPQATTDMFRQTLELTGAQLPPRAVFLHLWNLKWLYGRRFVTFG